MKIDYIDSKNLYLYLILHDSSGNALESDESAFSSFNDASASDFYIDLPQNSNRLGYYEIELSDIPAGDYTVEIWQHASGSSPNKSIDFLRSVDNFTFNGSYFIEPQLPKLSSPVYLQSINLGSTLTFIINHYNRFNNLQNFPGSTTGTFDVYSNITLNDSGNLEPLEEGIYYGQFVVTSGDYNYNSTNTIQVKSNYFGYQLGTSLNFDISEPAPSSSQNDFLSEGYVTGFVTVGISENNFYTTINGVNDFHNAAIVRFTSGNLRSQARIISDFISVSGEIISNKDFTSIPASGDPFVIFSIGGELNVI